MNNYDRSHRTVMKAIVQKLNYMSKAVTNVVKDLSLVYSHVYPGTVKNIFCWAVLLTFGP